MFEFKLDENDKYLMEDFQEYEELNSRINTEYLEDKRLMTVKTDHISAIISRDELISIMHLVKTDIISEYSIISISNIKDKKSNDIFYVNCNDLLQLEFQDIREIDSDTDLNQEISEEQINKIKNFIINNNKTKFIISCSYGISRSSAIGIFLEELIGTNENIEKIKSHNRYSPNKLILDKIHNLKLTIS